MKNAARKNKKRTLSLTSKVLMLVLILAAVAVVTPVVRAASDNKLDVLDVRLRRPPITLFNPFTLKTYYNIEGTSLRSADSSNSSSTSTLRTNSSLMNRPQIRIPFRPTVRSVFRPTYLNR